MGIKAFDKALHEPIYAIYGFVRYADEIVDTFHDQDKQALLDRFKKDTYEAIESKISLNPVLHAFQLIVNEYKIDLDLIEAFLHSMAMDLDFKTYNDSKYHEYIYGSAEVVGLMCLKVFCNGNKEQYNHLVPFARSLGAAFQKVNFLRDIRSDVEERGRVYFPGVDFNQFSDSDKYGIIQDVKNDFAHAYQGIVQLPVGCRLGVYTAYIYYLKLLEKIERTTAVDILESRVRIPNTQKIALLAQSFVKEKLMGA
jgi:phytoene synthase